MYSPLVKKGGIVAFHDVRTHHLGIEERCEVDKFWKEIKRKHQTTEFIEQEGLAWGGIGVIIK